MRTNMCYILNRTKHNFTVSIDGYKSGIVFYRFVSNRKHYFPNVRFRTYLEFEHRIGNNLISTQAKRSTLRLT